jgi:membrane protease YdiL (CAAX protease family)
MTDEGTDEGTDQGPAEHPYGPPGPWAGPPGAGAPPAYPGPQGLPSPRQAWPAPHGWAPPPAGMPPPMPGRRPVRPPYPHPEPREYHQMYRTWTYRWWRPVVGILALGAGMVIVLPLLALPVLVLGVLVEGGDEGFWDALERAVSFEELTPSALLYLNVSLAGLILWCWALIRILHQMRPRWLASVAPKLRWRYLVACLGLAVVALAASVVVSLFLPAGETDVDPAGATYTSTTLALAIVVLLTTPFQCVGEEYAFRGYLMQAVGSLARNRWVALVVTSTLFALAHGVQNFPLFFDRFMFGLVAGWLVIRTGGLEAGIAMHVLNNYVAYGFALAFSDINQTLNVSEVSWWNIPVTLTQSLVYAWLATVVANRIGLRNKTAPPPSDAAALNGGPPTPRPMIPSPTG